jgi:hypothetical protein
VCDQEPPTLAAGALGRENEPSGAGARRQAEVHSQVRAVGVLPVRLPALVVSNDEAVLQLQPCAQGGRTRVERGAPLGVEPVHDGVRTLAERWGETSAATLVVDGAVKRDAGSTLPERFGRRNERIAPRGIGQTICCEDAEG